VYNVRVSECHTCFVGGDKWGFSVWAHNAACTPDEVSKATREVLSTASFRGKGNLRARVVEALRLNDFDQAAAFLQELRGIGPARAEAIVEKLQERAPEAPPAPGPYGINLETLTPTNKVASHIPERPYINSTHTIREIIESGVPRPDPGGVPGALRWDAPGTFWQQGMRVPSRGVYELVIDPSTNRILHFQFKSGG
jgi:hypothetical protein